MHNVEDVRREDLVSEIERLQREVRAVRELRAESTFRLSRLVSELDRLRRHCAYLGFDVEDIPQFPLEPEDVA